MPDRLALLIERLEKGEVLTQDELRKLSQLQALDLARSGHDFADQQQVREDAQNELLRKLAEA